MAAWIFCGRRATVSSTYNFLSWPAAIFCSNSSRYYRPHLLANWFSIWWMIFGFATRKIKHNLILGTRNIFIFTLAVCEELFYPKVNLSYSLMFLSISWTFFCWCKLAFLHSTANVCFLTGREQILHQIININLLDCCFITHDTSLSTRLLPNEELFVP